MGRPGELKGPAWVPCVCGEFWCNVHEEHAFECPCPPVDEWAVSPYGVNPTKGFPPDGR